MISRLTKEYPTIGESEDRMLDDLAVYLDQFNLDTAIQHSLMLCISEAFTNALRHGNKWDESKQIVLNVEVNDESISADITDQGSGGLAAIGRRLLPEILAESGRGIDFIYRYCPNAELREVEGGGLQVKLFMPRRRTDDKNVLHRLRR
jgi:anti-sigma regulatory factor (Ser/Thr protein kinase)